MNNRTDSILIQPKVKLTGVLRLIFSILIIGDLIYSFSLFQFYIRSGVTLHYYEIIPFEFNTISFLGYTLYLTYNLPQALKEIKKSSSIYDKSKTRIISLILSLIFLIPIVFIIFNELFSLNLNSFFEEQRLLSYLIFTVIIIVFIVQDLNYVLKNQTSNRNI
jgi:hypothetical protein